jgi:predicted RNA-binding protein with TRAM domain
MTEISDSLRLLFETSVEADGDRYVISLPAELVENGTLATEETVRVALLAASDTPAGRGRSADASRPTDDAEESDTDTGSGSGSGSENETPGRTDPEAGTARRDGETPTSAGRGRRPPVERGEVRSVTIDTLGDQGDGLARVERGFVVIVPGTQPGDRVDVEITDVRETVAFAEPVSDASVR